MSDEKKIEETVENSTPVEANTEEVKDETTAVAEETQPTPEPTKPSFADMEAKLLDETPFDDFDWDKGNTNILPYTDEEIKNYLVDYEASLGSLSENEIVSAKVTFIKGGDVILDVNSKSDGLISLSEFRDNPDLAVGDMVDVYIESRENEKGQLQLSRRKAKLLKAWESIVNSYENGEIITGTIVSKTKGGLIADCGGLETFLPGSQIDIKPIIDYDEYVGKQMEFKVVKINEAIKNAVVSHKALIESDLADQREIIIKSLEKGQVLEGTVKNITDFGAFMDLGGVDGLLYITDISWGRINHPNEVLEINQQVNVVVLDFDENKKRISLGLKQLHPHPWDTLATEISEGSTVKGKIVNIEDYGAFLEIIPGVEGLIHVSEVSWSNQPVNAREHFTIGHEYESKVVTLDKETRKMSLSIKQLHDDPWDKIPELFPIGSTHTGEVKNLTPYGVFVELNDGIGGMVHISDLSWTKRYSHPSEFTKVGNDIEVQILDIDMGGRKLSLGHKQLEENPWDTFENVFPVGSYHEATIVKKNDSGGIIQLPYGLEAFAPAKHLRKEDNSYGELDETLTFKVIEFNRDDKRIIVSHLRYVDDIRKDAEDVVTKEKDKERKDTRKAITKTQSSVERTTLGELGVFSQLKEQFVESPKAKAPAPKPAAPKAEPKPEPVAETPAAKEEAPAKEEATAKEAKPAAKKKAADGKPDDLKKIEGIGPKIAEHLNNGGITTFQELADAEISRLQEILDNAGPRYRIHNPGTWPKQSALAAKGQWEELKTLQDELDGGR